MYNNYEILDKDFEQRYTGSFYQYYISVAYGNKVITAESYIEATEDE